MESVPNSNFLKVVAQGQKYARGNHLPMIRVRKSRAYFTQIDIEILKVQFKEAVGDISSFEIGQLEQQLIDEGSLDPKEISKLSDLHVDLFRDALNLKADYETIPGHPIHTYLQENLEIYSLLACANNDASLQVYRLNYFWLR